MTLQPARIIRVTVAAVLSIVLAALSSYVFLPSASAYEVATSAFSGGSASMPGSGLQQSWAASGQTSVTASGTIGGRGYVAGDYTPTLASSTPGTGVSVSASGCPTTGTCSSRGTVTVSFSQPVVNPVLHIAGLGAVTRSSDRQGRVGQSDFHAILTLTTAGTSLTKRSGGNLAVTGGNTITATDHDTSPNCASKDPDNTYYPRSATAGCGSVQVTTGSAVTSLSFTVSIFTTTNSQATGPASNLDDGADEINILATVGDDYGDAPSSYDAGDAARHALSNLTLGSSATEDNAGTANGTSSPNAGSGANGDTDNGVTGTLSMLSTDTTYSQVVSLSGVSKAATLAGWIDVNGNGTFESGERATAAVSAGQTSATLSWTGLSGAVAGATYARFRLGYTNAQITSPTGAADSGEVEDYSFTVVAPPNIDISKSFVSGTIDPVTGNGLATYTVTVANTGGPGAYGPLLDTAAFGAGLTRTNATWTTSGAGAPAGGSTNGAGPYTLAPAGTAIAATTTHTYTVFITYTGTTSSTNCSGSGSALYNSVAAVGENGGAGNNSACGTPATPVRSMTLKKTGALTTDADNDGKGDVGDVITYSFLVTNTGNINITGLAISDNVVAVSCPSANLSVGSAITCTATYPITQADVNAGATKVNTATATGTAAGVAVTSPQDSATTSLDRRASLSIDKSSTKVITDLDTNGPDAGDTVPFTFTITNTGTVPLTGVTVNDPEIAAYACPTTSLAPGASTTCTATYALTAADVAAGQAVNTATASAVPFGGTTITSAPDTETVPVPQPPTANPDTATTPQNVDVTVSPWLNDVAAPGPSAVQPTSIRLVHPTTGATVTSVTVSGQGTWTVNATGTVTFDPLPGFTGAATPIGYQIAAANGVTARSTITVTVTAITPSATDDTRTTAYDTTITVPVLTNDAAGAASAPLVVTSLALFDPATSTYGATLTVAGQGTYSANADGTVTFDPLASFSGTATPVTYRVADGNGTTAQATLTVTVRTPASAIPDAVTTPQDITLTLSPLANDTASGGATITASTVQLRDPATSTWGTAVTVAGQGTWTVNATGSVSFDPVPSFRGVATTLDYRATDSSGAALASTLAITVTPIDPTAISDEVSTLFNTPVAFSVLGNDSAGDPSAPILTSSVVFTAAAATNAGKTLVVASQGTFTANPGGSVTFTPADGFRGDTTPVTYRITDDNGQTATASIVVHVAQPSAPVANPDIRTTPQGIPVTVTPATNDLPGPTSGALVATSVQLFNPATGTYGSSLTVSGQGVWTVDAGLVTFAPVGSFTGQATPVGYRIADEYGATATSSITVTVTAVTPTAVNDARTTAYETPIDVTVLGNDTPGNAAIALDPTSVRLFDPVAGTYGTSVTIPGQGTYTVNSSGIVHVVPATGFHGTATPVTYSVKDANGTATTATLTITVSLPIAPVAHPDTATTPQNVDVTVNPLANDTTGAASVTLLPGSVQLLDPATGTYGSSLTVAGQGTYAVSSATGAVTFDPLPGFTGAATAVRYHVTDSSGQTVDSTVTVTVTAITPSAVNDDRATAYNTATTFSALANDSAGAASAPLAPTTVVFTSAAATNAGKTLVVAGQGTWTIDPATGQVSFNPLPGFTGATTAVTYRVADTNGTTAQAALTVTVGTAPTATPDTASTQQDLDVSLNPLTNDAAGVHGNGTAGTLVPGSVGFTAAAATNGGRTLVVAGQGTWTVSATTGVVTFDPLPAFTGTTGPVGYSVTDSYGNTATSTITVSVAAITPAAADDANSTAYRTPVSVSVLGNDAAGDASAPLVPSSVRLVNPVNGNAVSTVTVSGEGTWTIGAGGVVTFAPAVGFSGPASPIGYQVADDNGTLATAVVRIVVGTPPTAAPDSATTPQNVDVTLNPLANDAAGVHGNGTAGSLDATSVVFTAAAATNGGRTLVVAGEGTWTANTTTGAITFDPLPAFTGATTPAAYAVTDSFGNTAASTLLVTVTAITPSAVNDTRTTPYDTAVSADVLANDTAGAASAPLVASSVVLTSGAATNGGRTLVVAGQGTWTVNATTGVITFTPAAGFTGTATPVSYRVADANGTTAAATVAVTVGTAPVALPNTTTTPQDITVMLNPLSNDTAGVHGNGTAGTLDPTSVVFTAAAATDGGKSLVIAGEGTYTIDPATGAVGFDPLPAFSGSTTPVAYRVTDSFGNTASSTVSITVTPITPTAVDDTNATAFNTAVDTDVLDNDLAGAASAPLVATSVVLTSPAATNGGRTLVVAGEGTFTVDATTGVITFVPQSGFVGVTTPVRYRVADDNGTTATALLTITVGNAPTATPDTATTPQDLDVTLNPVANDTPGFAASLVAGSVRLLDPATGVYGTSVTLAGEGTYTVNTTTGRVTFDPLPAFTGQSSITYSVRDSNGNSAVATVTVTVTPIDPVATDDSRTTPYLTAVTADVVANDTAGDASAPLVSSSVVLTSPSATNNGLTLVVAGQGTYTVNAAGTITFTPVAGFSGPATAVQYRISDDNGTTDTAMLSITVGTAPIAVANTASTLQDVDVTLSPLDNDTAGAGGNGTPGTLVTSSVVFTAAAATNGGTTLAVAGQGTWTVNAAGTVGFDPLPAFTGVTSPVAYRVTDSFGNTAAATLTVTVTPVTPAALDDAATTPFNTTIAVSVLGNDTPGDASAPLVPSSVRLLDPTTGSPVGSVVVAGQGTWTANTDGTVSFNPAAGYVGTTTPVTYRVADDNGTSATATVRVTVQLPAGPTARPDTRSTPQDVTVTLDPLANDTAATGASLDPTTVVFTAAGATDGGKTLVVAGQGTWSVNPATGLVTFDPLPAFTGAATAVDYRVSDAYGQAATSSITLTVTPITPTAVDDTATTPASTSVAVDVLDNDAAGAASAPLVPSTVVFTTATATDGGRTLVVAGQGTYTIDPVTGVVTFAPVAGFSGATTPVRYRVADDNGTTASASLVVTVGSGPVARADSSTTPQNVTVTLNPLANDAAGIDGDGTPGTLIRGSVGFTGPAATDSGRTLVVAGEGTWTIDPVTGQVTFDPIASFTGVTTAAAYSVTDSFGNTAASGITVTVTPIVPSATDDTDSTPYRTAVTTDVVGNDTAGAASAPIVASSVVFTSAAATDGGTRLSVTGEGAYVVNPDGTVTFTPSAGFTGTATPVTYRVADANGTTDTAALTITVGSDAVALPDSATTPQDVTVSLDALTNDTPGTDGNGFPGSLVATSVRLTLGSATDGGHTLVVAGEGTWSINALTGRVSFDPVPAFTGTTTAVSYAVTDSFGNVASSTLRVTVTAITPSAVDDSATTPYRTPVDLDVLDNDAAGAPSAPLDPTTVRFTSGAATNGGRSLTVAGEGTWSVDPTAGLVTFAPANGFTGGTTAVTYRVADANGTAATARLLVTVGTAPIARSDSAITPQNVDATVQPLTNDTPGVDGDGTPGTFDRSSARFTSTTATDGGRSLSVAGEGTWTIAPVTGAVTFDPNPGFTGVTTPVAYSVDDSFGNRADSTITITVSPIAPTANDDTDSTAYGTAVTTPVLANDAPGALSALLDPSSVRLTSASATAGGTVLVTSDGRYEINPNGSVTFTPAAGFSGVTAPVGYRVADTNGTTATATLTITVGDAPVASPDDATTAQDQDVTVDPLDNDAPGAGATLDTSSVRLFDPATGTWGTTVVVDGEGTWTVHGDGTVTLDPEPTFTGDASVTYEVSDSDGNPAASTITVTVTPITPSATDDEASTPADRPVDIDVLANDDAGDASAPLDETSVVFTAAEATDDGHTLVVVGQGTWRIAPESGVVTFTPLPGFSGDTTAVAYRVADDNGTTATATVTVAVGTRAIALPDSATTAQHVAVTLDVLGNDTAGVHGDGTTGTLDPASVVLTSPAATAGGTMLVVDGQGTWTVTTAGTLTFEPEISFTGVTTPVAYAVTDSWLTSASSSATVTVTPITPSATDDHATTPASTPVTVDVLANDDAGAASAPLDPTTVVFTSPGATDGGTTLAIPGQGTWTVNADGTLTFVPVDGFAGLATAVDYQVADVNGTPAVASVTVTVGDGPSALPDSATTQQATTVRIDVLTNDSAGIDGDGVFGDLDAASVVFTSVSATDDGHTLVVAGEGTWTVNPDGSVAFDPIASFTGDTTPVAYAVTNSFGNSASSTVSVTVTAITPTADDDSASTDYGTPVAVDVLANDAPGDASAPLDPASVVFTSADATDEGHTLVVDGEGTWTVGTDGTLTFTPADGFSGDTTPVTYRVADDNGTTATAQVAVTVGLPAGPHAQPDTETTPQNTGVIIDPLVNDSAGAGTGVSLDPTTVVFTSPDATDGGHTLVVTGEGTWTIDPVTGVVTFEPIRTFTGTTTPVDYAVEDNFGQSTSSTITITVTPVTPLAEDDNASTPHATPVTLQVLANDTPGAVGVSLVGSTVLLHDPESGDWVTQLVVPGEGSWTVNGNGSVTFAPDDAFSGAVTPVDYRVTDQNGTSVEATITIKVGAPSQTAPVAAPDRVKGTEPGAPVTVPVLDNDTAGSDCAWDVTSVEFTSADATDDGKTLVVEGEGTWTVNADGSVTFTPEDGFHGAATPVDYQVTDECGETVGSTVTVSVPKAPATCSGHADCPVGPTDPVDPEDPSGPHHPADHDNPVHQPVLPNTGGPRLMLLGLGVLLVLAGVPLVRRRRREA